MAHPLLPALQPHAILSREPRMENYVKISALAPAGQSVFGRSASDTSEPRQSYCRSRDLPRLIGLWPHEIDDHSEGGRRNLLGKLRRALREERRRGLAGHWTYDIARHAGLLRAYRGELTSRGAFRAPSSWPVATAPPHSSAPPSDNRAADSTSRDTRRAKACSACADGASEI